MIPLFQQGFLAGQMEAGILYQDVFRLLDYLADPALGNAVGGAYVELGAVLPVIHQKQKKLVGVAKLGWRSPAWMLSGRRFPFVQGFQHLAEYFPLDTGQAFELRRA